MMSEAGRTNFQRQLQQMIGSIQYTNDIDVHIALITAPSFLKERSEKYYSETKTSAQILREHIDAFGFLNKNQNGMDILIEDCKATMEQWGAQPPTFLLCNPKLTFQMTMSPTATEYVTHGPDGQKKLAAGPNINSYRGLSVIRTRTFALEDGGMPRDVLRRRTRTGEFYSHTQAIAEYNGGTRFNMELYDEGSDQFSQFSPMDYKTAIETAYTASLVNAAQGNEVFVNGNTTHVHWLVFRPVIEHEMHGIVIGRGGVESLGCTFWGQTELSVYDDAMHGIWGMSYKYNERAMVLNNKHLMRIWDCCYDNYCGGKGLNVCDDFENGSNDFQDLFKPYNGPSIWMVPVPSKKSNFTESNFQLNMQDPNAAAVPISPEQDQLLRDVPTLLKLIQDHIDSIVPAAGGAVAAPTDDEKNAYMNWVRKYLPDLSTVHMRKPAGTAANENETSVNSIVFKGTYRIYNDAGNAISSNNGCSHHGTDYVGAASCRSGKGVRSMVAGIGAPTFLPAPPAMMEIRNVP